MFNIGKKNIVFTPKKALARHIMYIGAEKLERMSS